MSGMSVKSIAPKTRYCADVFIGLKSCVVSFRSFFSVVWFLFHSRVVRVFLTPEQNTRRKREQQDEMQSL